MKMKRRDGKEEPLGGPVAVRRAMQDRWARLFFGSNAFLAVMALALISLFIAREAFFFFPQYHAELVEGRRCGMELTDRMGQELRRLGEPVGALREREAALREAALRERGTEAALGQADLLAAAAGEMEALLLGGVDSVVRMQEEARLWRQRFAEAEGSPAETLPLREEAAAWSEAAVGEFAGRMETMGEALAGHAARLQADLAEASGEPVAVDPSIFYAREREELRVFLAAGAVDQPVAWWASVGAFLTGKRWVTNSFNRELYGLLPLLSGTLLVSLVAGSLAVPLGLASALYVNQFATPRERLVLKPVLEFLAAFPTVLLGFLGVVFWGDIVQAISALPMVDALPGFPLQDRLNALTAGSLLALVAIPVIFTLSEDALNAVSRDFTEASLSVGATRVQTLWRVVLPAASPGLLSAVLLGFGRIMGETMIVLLVAGNRIRIPGLGDGVIPFFEPVHTMTGIIAQEMGEVSSGGLHYRALFVVAAVLFLLALGLNHMAREVTRPMRRRARSRLTG